jgi:hypothetical protein
MHNNEELPKADDGSCNAGTLDFDMGMPDKGDKDNWTNILPPTTNDKVTYSKIVARAGELAQTCSNHQSLMRTLLCNINTMIVWVCGNQDIHIPFYGGLVDVQEQSLQGMPHPAISQAITNSTIVRRKQSRGEFNS